MTLLLPTEVSDVFESISMKSILHHHLEGFRNPATGQFRRQDLVLHYLVPLALGGAWWAVGPRDPEMGNFIAGLAILTGLFLALLVYVFQLRLDIDAEAAHQRSTRLIPLIDALFHNSVYAALACGATTVVAVIADLTSFAPRVVGSAVIILGVHVAFTALMVMRRAQTAYLELLKDKSRARLAARR